jgi:hypothetical protein
MLRLSDGTLLEMPCKECKEKGKVHIQRDDRDYWDTCSVCDGLKFVPTKDGRVILDFLSKYLLPK